MVLSFLHLMSYGILLGSQVFQSFINGITAFKALGKSYFGIHQAAIFPVYFSLQSFLPIAVILTSPMTLRQIHVSRSGLGQKSESLLSGIISGYVDTTMSLVVITGLINLLIFKPLTASAVKARTIQELKDKIRDESLLSSPSPALVSSQRRFMVIHSMSIVINMCGLLATIWYGVALAMCLE